MAALLAAALQRGIATDYVRRLLAAVGDTGAYQATRQRA
jgi:hypothetical protein